MSFLFQITEVKYECLVHLAAPSVRIPATRLDENSVVCDAFQVPSVTLAYYFYLVMLSLLLGYSVWICFMLLFCVALLDVIVVT